MHLSALYPTLAGLAPAVSQLGHRRKYLLPAGDYQSPLTMRLAWRGAAASSNDGRSPSRARPERPDVHAQDIGALLLERLWVRMAWRIRALLLHD